MLFLLRVMSALLLSAFLGFVCAAAFAEDESRIAIVGADVLPMTGTERLRDQIVIVRGDRIEAIGPRSRVKVPAGAKRIDATGMTLMPGLVDMHVHLAPVSGAPGDAAQRALAVMLGHGVTTARGMAGSPNNLLARTAVERGEIPGPRFYAAAPPLHPQSARTVEEARAAVAAAKAAGFDLIKSHHLTEVAIWQAVQDEAKKQGLPVGGHVTFPVGLDRAMAAGQQIEHLDAALAALVPESSPARQIAFDQVAPPPVLEAISALPDSAYDAIARRAAAAKSWHVPTVALFEGIGRPDVPTETLRAKPEMRFIPDPALAQWSAQRAQREGAISSADGARFIEARRKLVRAFAKAGVPMMAGSDTAQNFHVWGPGLIEEIEALAAAGLTPMQALRTATVVPRDYFRSLPNGGSSLGWKADFGTVERGARADLILLSADPSKDLSALRKLSAVIAGGRHYDRAALDAMLAKASADAKAVQAPPPPAAAGSAAAPVAPNAKVALAACEGLNLHPSARCGKVAVPEDRRKPGGRMIDVHFAVIPASGKATDDPIVMLPGGPGLGGVQSGPGVEQMFGAMHANRDILLIDQRGTGRSNPLTCPQDAATADPLGQLGSATDVDVGKCRDTLLQKADLGLYHTREAVLDMEVVRDALGYAKLDLFGMSYGSRMALDYLRMFPDRVGETVIRSAAPPAMTLPLWTPRDAQTSYDRLVAACREQADCAARYPDLAGNLKTILARLDKEKAPISIIDPTNGKRIQSTLSRDGFSSVLFFLLYIPELYVQLPPLIEKGAAGDLSPMVQAAAPFMLGIGDQVAWGMRWSVICDEDVRRIDGKSLAKAVAGTFMGAEAVEGEIRACKDWPRAAVPTDYLQPVASEKPVFIISGEFDPIAGEAWGKEVKKTLPNSLHVEVKGASHLPPFPGCTPALVQKFLEGTAPSALDTGCIAETKRPQLRVAA